MKNVIIFNNRSLHLYDFKELKKNYNLRISAVVFNESFQQLSKELKESLDHIYVLPDVPYIYKSLESFPPNKLDNIVKEAVKIFPNTWLIAADELNNLTISFLRDKYKIPGNSYTTILKYRNKLTQKVLLKKHGFSLPKFMAIERENIEKEGKNTYKELVCFLGLPFIVKPLNMFGSIGVEKINSYDQFVNYFKSVPHFSKFITEEFIEGILYHCDFIIKNNHYYFTEVSEYLQNGLAFLKGYNHGSLLLQDNNTIRSSIIEFCKKANSILGVESGCGHFEVFMTDKKELIFLEAAARPAGSMVPVVFSKTFKKNYMNAALLADIDEEIGSFKHPTIYYFWVCFPNEVGIIKALKNPTLKSSFTINWNNNIGDTLTNNSLSLVERSGTILASNQNYKILQSDFYSLKHFKPIEIQ